MSEVIAEIDSPVFDVQVGNGIESTVIVDNLTSTATDAALSANQGRVLNESMAKVSDLSSEATIRENADAALAKAISNLDPSAGEGKSLVVDDTLTISGAGADAAVTGTRIRKLETDAGNLYFNTISEMKAANFTEGDVCIVIGNNGGIFEIQSEYIWGDAVALNNGLYAKKKFEKFPRVKNSKNVLNGDYIYIMSWDDTFTGQSYCTNQYDEFYQLNCNSLATDYPACDPDLLWHNNKIYCANDYTNSSKIPSDIDQSVFIFSNEIHFNYTDDLKNWSSTIQVDIPSEYWQTAAPAFFTDDDGSIYLFFTGTTSHTKDSSSNRYPVGTYYIKALNDSLTEWTTPTEVTLSNGLSLTIDPCVVKKDGTYYLFVKDDTTGSLYEYSSSSLSNAFALVAQIDAGYSNVEGYQCIKFNGTYYLYAEEVSSERIMSTRVGSSSDLLTWSTFVNVNSFYDIRTKHFGALVVDTEEKHEMFDTALAEYGDFKASAIAYSKSRPAPVYTETLTLDSEYIPEYDGYVIVEIGENATGKVADQFASLNLNGITVIRATNSSAVNIARYTVFVRRGCPIVLSKNSACTLTVNGYILSYI